MYYDYLIIGAGPGGLQLGYYMAYNNYDYLIIEKSNICGSFFKKYPKHRKLISINKTNIKNQNSNFRMRHDRNSLLCET